MNLGLGHITDSILREADARRDATHRPRRVPDGYSDSVTGRTYTREVSGPMGLRCLHPFEPAMVIQVPRDAGLAYRNLHDFHADYPRCAFDDCVCVCHEAGGG